MSALLETLYRKKIIPIFFERLAFVDMENGFFGSGSQWWSVVNDPSKKTLDGSSVREGLDVT